MRATCRDVHEFARLLDDMPPFREVLERKFFLVGTRLLDQKKIKKMLVSPPQLHATNLVRVEGIHVEVCSNLIEVDCVFEVIEHPFFSPYKGAVLVETKTVANATTDSQSTNLTISTTKSWFPRYQCALMTPCHWRQ